MSPKELPPPSGGSELTALLRSRHNKPPTPAINPFATADPFTPQPVDPAAVTGTDAERLAVYEAAIDRAKDTADQSLKGARARFVVEAGTALREIRDQNGGLYKVAYATFEEYISRRWEMDRTRAYQLIDAAPAMLVMSKIFDTPPVESQARILGPVLKMHGEVAMREVVAAARQSGKLTAKVIRETADRLGYIPAQPAGDDDEPAGDELPAEHTPEQALHLVRLVQGLAALKVAHKALRGSVIPDALAADPGHGQRLASEVEHIAAAIRRLVGRA